MSSRVIVVGAGPAGALSALLLARRGVDVTLLERNDDFAREFRGEVLQPGGLAVLAEVGLGDGLARVPQHDLKRIEIMRRNRMLFGIDVGELLGGPVPRAVSQPHLLELMVAQGEELPGYRCLRGVRVVDLIQRDGRVAGVQVREDDGQTRPVEGDYVLAADGRFSVLRVKAGLHAERHPQSFDIVWCKIDPPPSWPGEHTGRVYLGGNHFGIVLPLYDGRLLVGWVIQKGSFGDLRSRGMEAWLGSLAEHVDADFAAHLRAGPGRLTDPFLLNVVCDQLVDWTRPGLMLIGDAAHPMSPVGGQGLNIALRDAVVLDARLGPLLAGGAAARELDAAATAVQHERLVETQAIQEQQRRIPERLFAGGWRSRLLIDGLAPLLVRTGMARRFLRENLLRFAYGVTDVHYRAPGKAE